VALVALLSATVVIAQASQNFAIACGSIIDGGGGDVTSAHYSAITALGIPMVPPNDGSAAPSYAVRSANYGLRAGFLPGYSTGGQVSVATAATTAPNSGNVQAVTRMPIIYGMIRAMLGGCIP